MFFFLNTICKFQFRSNDAFNSIAGKYFETASVAELEISLCKFQISKYTCHYLITGQANKNERQTIYAGF